jgi:hypothetical protein
MGEWDDLRWFIVFNGIADAWLWGFDADGWRLRHGSPAGGALGILPERDGGEVAKLEDALWLADALAFDHDAPVGVRPAVSGAWPRTEPIDPMALPPSQPLEPFEGPLASWYWDALASAYSAAADLRFNSSYVIRYDGASSSPSTDFKERFRGKEPVLSMYAMAVRQADILSEYLCLYRVLESADGANGKEHAAAELPDLTRWNYGSLSVARTAPFEGQTPFIDVFDTYKQRASAELQRLAEAGVSDVPHHLYRIRNSLAHGKIDVLAGANGAGFQTAARALPIVKLLARRAVEPG